MEFELKTGNENSVYLHDEAHSGKNEEIKIVDDHRRRVDDNRKQPTYNDNNISSSVTNGYDNSTLNESQMGKGVSSPKRPIQLRNRDDEFIVKRKRSAAVSYETVVWVVFFVFNVAILIDRFTGNGDIVCSRKRKLVHRLNNEKWGLTITNYIWAFTARTLIVAQNLMFYTTLWCIPNIFVDIAPRWLRTNGIRDTHIKIHRLCGIFLIGIPVLAHVFLIFIPPLVDKTKLHYHPPSEYNYSKQPFGLNWTRIYDPAAVDGFRMSQPDGVHITSDEVYRTVLMVVLFCILFPISRSKWLNDRSYSLAIVIHGFAGFWYAIDNVRKLSHALAWVFNIPLMIVWLIDRFLSVKYYRKSQAQIVEKRIVGNNEYVDIRIKLSKNFNKTAGDVYYLLENERRSKCISFERSHPFTSFSNHTKDTSWDVGFIITTVEDHLQSSAAWTRRLRSMDEAQGEINLQSWGPYRSSSSELYKELFLNETPSYVLFGSGSGFGYISDALSILAYKLDENNTNNNTPAPSIHIHYSARTVGLLYNFAKETEEKLKLIKEKNTASVTFHWYVTSDNTDDIEVNDIESTLIDIVKGRVHYERIIQRCAQSTSIYFTGRPSISDMVQSFADKYHKRLVKDYVNTQRGTSDKTLIVKYLKYTFWAVLVTIFFCFALAIYLKIK